MANIRLSHACELFSALAVEGDDHLRLVSRLVVALLRVDQLVAGQDHRSLHRDERRAGGIAWIGQHLAADRRDALGQLYGIGGRFIDELEFKLRCLT